MQLHSPESDHELINESKDEQETEYKCEHQKVPLAFLFQSLSSHSRVYLSSSTWLQ